MKIVRSRTAAAFTAVAALSLAATPAMARDRYRHHDRGIDGGDVLAGLLIVGGVAAIAAAASNKSKKDRQAREDARYRDDYRSGDYRADDYRSGDYRTRDYPQNSNGSPSAGYGDDRSDTYRDAPGGTDGSQYGRSSYSVDGAVDACVGEVERGSRSIESVDGVNREGEGWRVAGRVRGGYGFSCVIDRDGRVRSVEGL